MIHWRTPSRSAAEARAWAGFTRWMETYWSAAEAWWRAAEAETALYATELAAFKASNPRPNLREYMIQTAGQPRR